MDLAFSTVDVFTTARFAGNQLAVVELSQGQLALSQARKQQIANEFNLSETVFVHPRGDGTRREDLDGRDAVAPPRCWTIDIFTPAEELPLAGHPVIGTASLLLGREAAARPHRDSDEHDEVDGEFITKAGRITLSYNVRTKLARAAIPHHLHHHAAPLPASEIRRLQPGLPEFGQESPVVSIVRGMAFALIALPSLQTLAAVRLMGSGMQHARDADWDAGFFGLLFYHVVAREPSLRIRSRMVECSVGEDAATGSASCALAAYLAREAQLRAGSSAVATTVLVEITQGVEMGRASDIRVEVAVAADGTVTGVWLAGAAVLVTTGTLLLDDN